MQVEPLSEAPQISTEISSPSELKELKVIIISSFSSVSTLISFSPFSSMFISADEFYVNTADIFTSSPTTFKREGDSLTFSAFTFVPSSNQ